MAFTPYDQAGWAEYTPLSSNEILQPAMIMGERHANLENEYGAINDELQKLAFIAETEPDPMVKQRYASYMNSLQSGMQSLQDRGVTPQSRRAMLDVRSRYNSEMMPIKVGYETKLKDIDMYNQMRLKDPSWMGINPANRGVSDYINNGLNPMPLEGVSGEVLAKQAADMADQYSQIMQTGDPQGVLHSIFGPQYQEIMSGAIPGSEAYRQISEYIKKSVLDSNKDNLNWARDEEGQIDPHVDAQIQAHLDRGLSHTIGKSQLLRDGMWSYNMAEAERLREAEGVEEPQLPPPIPSTRIRGEFVINSKVSELFNDFDNRNTNSHLEALTAPTYEDYKNRLEDKGERLSGDTKLSSNNFDPYKAAYEIKEEWENKSQEERLKEMQQMYPEADVSDLTKYAAQGYAGVIGLSALAGKMGWLASSGITTAGAGAASGAATAGTLALPLIALGVFGSGQDIRDVNRRRVAETLDAMENPATKQAVSALSIPSIDDHEYSRENRLKMMEQDHIRRGVIANDAYTFNTATTAAAERREALSFAKDLRTSGGTITVVDKNNRKKEVIRTRDMNKKLKDKELQELIKLSEKDYKGHTAVNENFDYNPAYQFTKVIGDKTYYIDIPANTLKEDYSAFKTIFETINSGISGETIVKTIKGVYKVAPYISNGTIQYGIMDDNKNVVTIDRFLEEARNSVGERYYDMGETRTERRSN